MRLFKGFCTNASVHYGKKSYMCRLMCHRKHFRLYNTRHVYMVSFISLTILGYYFWVLNPQTYIRRSFNEWNLYMEIHPFMGIRFTPAVKEWDLCMEIRPFMGTCFTLAGTEWVLFLETIPVWGYVSLPLLKI